MVSYLAQRETNARAGYDALLSTFNGMLTNLTDFVKLPDGRWCWQERPHWLDFFDPESRKTYSGGVETSSDVAKLLKLNGFKSRYNISQRRLDSLEPDTYFTLMHGPGAECGLIFNGKFKYRLRESESRS